MIDSSPATDALMKVIKWPKAAGEKMRQ